MNHYRFTLTCSDCDGDLRLGRGEPIDVDHTAAVATCKACGTEWDIDVRALRRPTKRSRIARVSDRVDAAAEAAVLTNHAL